MELINHAIFFGGFLIAISILVGMFSSRIGAPLLLVFLALGMLAGEDGPGGIEFDNFHVAYLVGSVALAVILFDGGLRTPRAAFRIAARPALTLATIGVLLTAVLVAGTAMLFLRLSPLEGFLLGATVASTDAAAVFLLLHAHGTEINRRVSATLEVESGANDPMAVFLTVACVEALLRPDIGFSWTILGDFVLQMAGGAAIGAVGGVLIAGLVNRIEISAVLYPILVSSLALMIFAGANMAGASGFLAVYLAGIVLGNRRHRAQKVISRFQDGFAWLAQITMFLMLGLLVTPSRLFYDFWAEIAVALALILFARPVAVWLCLLPFRFSWQEKTFIAWVGLRGAVPIFLASIPVMAGVPRGIDYFHVAFVVVFASLVIQGWTVARAAEFLGLALPPAPEPTQRREIDLPPSADREAASWRVAPGSPVLDVPFQTLNLPRRTRIIAVIRNGAIMNRETLERLQPGDDVIALTPPEHVITLDTLFAPRPVRTPRWGAAALGEFGFDAGVTLGQLGDLYGIPYDPADADKALGEFMHERLGENFVVGDRVAIGGVELIAREMDEGRIMRVGLEIEPAEERLPILRFWRWLLGRSARLADRIAWRRRGL